MIYVKSVFLIISTVICLFNSSCCNHSLSLHISTPLDGTILKTNIIQVIGDVSNPKATVTINGQEAYITGKGSFNKYVELKEGTNTIEAVAKLGGKSITTYLQVVFNPSLVLHLNLPDISTLDISNTGNLVIFTGFVFPPQASVKINDNSVSVNDDGAFNYQIKLEEGNNIVHAVATLGDESDGSQWTLLLENGVIRYPPGQNLGDNSRFVFDSAITMRVGHTAVIDIDADIGKDIQKPSNFRFSICRVGAEYHEVEIAMAEGMNASIEPAGFTIYPNTKYTPTLNIVTSSKTPPGEYYFLLSATINNSKVSWNWIKVNVTT